MNRWAAAIVLLPVLAVSSGASEVADHAKASFDASDEVHTPLEKQDLTGKPRPNLIVILADDMGVTDVGAFHKLYPAAPEEQLAHRYTPNLDRLAEQGIRCTRAYAAAWCAPSRQMLLSGQWVNRRNAYDHLWIGSRLRQAGYVTGLVPFTITAKGGEYLTDVHNDHAVEFIERNADRPFMLYLPYNAPHGPLDGKPEDLRKLFPEVFWEASDEDIISSPLMVRKNARDRTNKLAAMHFAAMVYRMDLGIGRIMKALEEQGIIDNTLVIFTSDNARTYGYGEWLAENHPFTGHKSEMLDGGHRVPSIARWPGRTKPNQACDALATTMDYLPTIAHLAGAPLPEDRVIDGKNIWPLMSGEVGARSPHDSLFYYNGTNLQVVRQRRWKLHLPRDERMLVYWAGPKLGGIRDLDQPILFDLAEDLAETTDVAARHPEVIERLLQLAADARLELVTGIHAVAIRRSFWTALATPTNRSA